MSRWYSKQRKRKYSSELRITGLTKYCGFKYDFYGNDFSCCKKDGLCLDCTLKIEEQELTKNQHKAEVNHE